MPRPITTNAFLEVTMVQEMNNQTLLNVLHYRWNGSAGVDGDDVTTLLDDTVFGGATGVPARMKAINSTQWSYVSTRYQWVHPVRYTPTVSLDEAGTGDVAEPPLPQNVAVVITKKSTTAGRPGIGSVHLGGLTADDVSNGLVTAGRIASMVAIGNELTDVLDTGVVLAGSTLTPCIGPSTNPPDFRQWTDFTPQATVRVMRRRTVGLGI